MARFAPPAVRSASGVNARTGLTVIRRTDCTIYSKRGTGEQLREANAALIAQSYTDSLTGYRIGGRFLKI